MPLGISGLDLTVEHIAHELARLKSHDTRPGTVAVPLLRWFGRWL